MKFLKIHSLVFTIGCCIMLSGCEKNTIGPLRDVHIDLQLIDKNGNDADHFEMDSTLIFRLILYNDSRESKVSFAWWGDVGTDKNFLMVFKKNTEGVSEYNKIKSRKNDFVEVGRPFVGFGGNSILIVPTILPQEQFVLSETQWMDNPVNTPLTKGSYYMDFYVKFSPGNNFNVFHIIKLFVIQ